MQQKKETGGKLSLVVTTICLLTPVGNQAQACNTTGALPSHYPTCFNTEGKR
jgi:hypothetical protein